jgi:N-acetylmuramoyl-L-alanine amidase
MNHSLVVLDAAHGGPELGAHLGDTLLEKDFTMAFAGRLRAALQTQGFTVVSTRDSDPAAVYTTDQRADIANRAHAVACIVLHATTNGSGVHLYASALQPADALDAPPSQGGAGSAVGASPQASKPFELVPWDQAQAPTVRQSLHLQSDLAAAISAGGLPLVAGRASVRPLDNLTCPAVVLELAPLVAEGQDTIPVTDAGYQQRAATAVATALLSWRGHADASAPAAKATTEDFRKALPERNAPSPAAQPAPMKPGGGPKR